MNNLVSGRSNFADSYYKINNNHMFLVYKIDRLGRNSVCIEKILQGWQNRGVDFHSVLENVSYKSDIPENFAMNKIIIDQVRLAQEESDKKSRDLKKRHEIAKLEGKSLNCSAPYGFKKKRGKQIINFKEQKVIKHIIKQFKTFGSETNNYGFPISVEEIAAKVCKKMNNSTKYNNRRGLWRNKRIVDLFNNFKSNKTYLNSRDPDKKASKQSSSSSSSSSSSYYYQQRDQESTQEIQARLKDLEEQLKTMRQNEASSSSSSTSQTSSSNDNTSSSSFTSSRIFSSFFG
jgi:DNA invertase Pin-like site-specific DNA recombinase